MKSLISRTRILNDIRKSFNSGNGILKRSCYDGKWSEWYDVDKLEEIEPDDEVLRHEYAVRFIS